MKAPTSGSAWKYCMYSFRPAKGGGWYAANRLRHLAYGFPRSFVWKDKDDKEGLRSYVELIAAGRKTEAALIEGSGAVTEIEYDPEQLTGCITVDADAFFSTLALTGYVKIPLVERVRFTLNGRAITAAEYLTILGEYSGKPDWFNPNGARWATPDEVEELQPHSAMYTDERLGQAELPAPEEPPRETEISRTSYDRHFEMITLVEPSSGKPYFVRRVANLHGTVIWSGSAFSPKGPWKEYSRNSAQLIALGVST